MKRILIIDDEESIRMIFTEILTRAGYAVDAAGDGRKGIARLAETGADLVITDIMMPEMDGLEVLQQIRGYNEDLPVIAISGGMRDRPINFLPHAKKMGACQVLEKPIGMKELLAAVQAALHEES